MKYNYRGLSVKEVYDSRRQFGRNELASIDVESIWDKLIANFKDPIIIILCVALFLILGLSFFGLTEWFEAVAIAAAVALAVLVATFSEHKNESSFQKLQEEASKINANVFRDGKVTALPIEDIVKGDFILLQSGDKIPADGYLLDGKLKVNQASLTGESEPVKKSATNEGYVLKENNFSDPHFIFRGAVVEEGEAVMLVDRVGLSTFYGQLTEELNISDNRLSPLQLKLENLARLISKFGYIGAVLIAVSFLFNKVVIGHQFDLVAIIDYVSNWKIMLRDVVEAAVLAVIVIVAAVPEGLPMMIAIVLSLNMRKMLKEKVLVRKLLGIETAGSLNILFSDKTGTITKGDLEATFFLTGKEELFTNYSDIPEKLKNLVRIGIAENSYCVVSTTGEPAGGNISEQALISYLDPMDRVRLDTETKVLNNIHFNSAIKYSATEVEGSAEFSEVVGKKHVTLVKGATEIILRNCSKAYDTNGKIQDLVNVKQLIESADKYADRGIRLIAVAISEEQIAEDHHLPENLTLIGIVGIRDDIREESHMAIREAIDAGIQVVMITGDRRGTAESIAREVGLFRGPDDIILTSDQLQLFTDEELMEVFEHLRVIARALPTDKSRLVRIAKRLGKVAGMTGDGVNDSPALKQADVGFAMGSGSEVAKESGDIVILDDNFNSITNAVRYGRTIFKSIRKFIVFQLTVNVAAVSTIFFGQYFGIESPLTILQILWINIIMDTLAALAFGGEPALQKYMENSPIDRDENILSKPMVSSIFTSGIYITIFSLAFLSMPFFKEMFLREGVFNETVFYTVFFNLFVFFIVFNSFNVRAEKLNLFENIRLNMGFIKVIGLIMFLQIFFTYVGGEALRAVPLKMEEWGKIFILSFTIIPVDLIRKLILYGWTSKK